jgi:hypothetical protein
MIKILIIELKEGFIQIIDIILLFSDLRLMFIGQEQKVDYRKINHAFKPKTHLPFKIGKHSKNHINDTKDRFTEEK